MSPLLPPNPDRRQDCCHAISGFQRSRQSNATAPALRRIAAFMGVFVGLSLSATAATWPVTEQQRDQAQQVSQAGVALSDLATNAPDQYTVKSGDTLWAIAALFLKSPWRWPDLWGFNLALVKNPHLIYPGQSLSLVKTNDGRAHLQLDTAAPAPSAVATQPGQPETDRLSPRIRDLGSTDHTPIPSIPNALIEPFLARPQILPDGNSDAQARMVASPYDRQYLGVGDNAYVRGLSDASQDFHVLRPAHPLFEPDDLSHEHPLAWEAVYLGTARLIQPGELATVQITSSAQEISVGDRLIPIQHQGLINYAPHLMAQDNVRGRIISVYSGLQSVGADSIVTLDLGKENGLETGHVLAVYQHGKTIVDKTTPDHDRITLPSQRAGLLFVFQVFNKVSYGLLMSASRPIQVGDWVASPEQPNALDQH